MNCDKCLHAGVCKNEEFARSVETSINQTIGNDEESLMSVTIRCKKFKMKYSRRDKKEE